MGRVYEQPQGRVQNPWVITARYSKLPSPRGVRWCSSYHEGETEQALWKERAAWQELSCCWKRSVALEDFAGQGREEVINSLTSPCFSLWFPDAHWLVLPRSQRPREARESVPPAQPSAHRARGEGWEWIFRRARGRCGSIFEKPLNKAQCKKRNISDVLTQEQLCKLRRGKG